MALILALCKNFEVLQVFIIMVPILMVNFLPMGYRTIKGFIYKTVNRVLPFNRISAKTDSEISRPFKAKLSFYFSLAAIGPWCYPANITEITCFVDTFVTNYRLPFFAHRVTLA